MRSWFFIYIPGISRECESNSIGFIKGLMSPDNNTTSFGQIHHRESSIPFSKTDLQFWVLPQKRVTSTVLLENTGEHFNCNVSSTSLGWDVSRIWPLAGPCAVQNVEARTTVNHDAMISGSKMLSDSGCRQQQFNGKYQFIAQVWVPYTTMQSGIVVFYGSSLFKQ